MAKRSSYRIRTHIRKNTAFDAGVTGIYMTNSVTHVIPKIARICGYGITALTVAFLLEMVFEIMYENLCKTVEYNGVYYLPSIDTYMEICYGAKDSKHPTKCIL